MSRVDQLVHLAELAQSYGFVPVPVKGKQPRFRDWPTLRYDPRDPTKNIRRVRHLAESGLADNLAILTGEASHVVVIDVEAEDLAWWRQVVYLNGGLPDTLTVRTGSGGEHIYFQYTPNLRDIGNRNRILGHHLDYRTNGGLILFPGSIHPQTQEPYLAVSGYEDNHIILAPMPDWLVAMLRY